jgi:hypothetical protein
MVKVSGVPVTFWQHIRPAPGTLGRKRKHFTALICYSLHRTFCVVKTRASGCFPGRHYYTTPVNTCHAHAHDDRPSVSSHVCSDESARALECLTQLPDESHASRAAMQPYHHSREALKCADILSRYPLSLHCAVPILWSVRSRPRPLSSQSCHCTPPKSCAHASHTLVLSAAVLTLSGAGLASSSPHSPLVLASPRMVF